MHRAILIQCLPALIALMISFAAVVLLMKFSGARLNWRRLRELHRCQDGGVQSLSFVLTLPMFLMFVLFIVQISQLMIGLVTVNYAAYAAARSASVWIPAEVHDANLGIDKRERQNRFHPDLPIGASDPQQRMMLVPFDADMRTQLDTSNLSHKFGKIRMAAVMGCAPISPSREIQMTSNDQSLASIEAIPAAQNIYGGMVPSSANNGRIKPRIENKIRYADRNTAVFVEWQDSLPGTNSIAGPTYNPVGHPNLYDYDHLRNDDGTPMTAADAFEEFGYKEYEVGWQDPVTVYVVHRFALFPGPGRWVAGVLIRPVGIPARVGQLIPASWQQSYVAETETYSVLIPAAVTLPAEGIKSRRGHDYFTN